VKPPLFRYLRPRSVEEALEMLAEHGDDARVLAGGQSLVPMLNLRLVRPAVIVDLGFIGDLDGIEASGGTVTLGAMARQEDVRRSASVVAVAPLLRRALGHVANAQIRTRGTVGGSLAHADPAAELPAVALLTDAELTLRRSSGAREVGASAFFAGPWTTSRAPDELLTSVRLPAPALGGWAFEELARRPGDAAIAGVAAGRYGGQVRLVGFGLGRVPVRLTAAEAAIGDGPLGRDAIRAAAAAATDEVDPFSDIHADAEYRREAIGVLVERTLSRLALAA
jgi:carbon-monoxide dehydrogenase medium subunit